MFFAASFSTPVFNFSVAIDLIIDLLAWLLFLIYAFVRVWATLYIGGRKEKELVTEGPYALCRNPLYLGSLCFGASFGLFLDSAVVLGGVIILAIAYRFLVVPSEESVLRERFGDQFDRYVSRTPFLLMRPRFLSADRTLSVSTKAIRAEMKRLFLASCAIFAAFSLCWLRMQPWWPHYFKLP